MFPTLVSSLGVKVAAAATAAALLAGGAAGASAALGGPNVASSVHSVLTGSGHGHHGDAHGGDAHGASANTSGNGPGTGHQHCSQATQKALRRLNELKSEGKPVDKAIHAIQNCGMGSDGTGDHSSSSGHLPDSANPNADEQSDNASQGIGNAGSEASTGISHANSHATAGSDNAGSHAPDGP